MIYVKWKKLMGVDVKVISSTSNAQKYYFLNIFLILSSLLRYIKTKLVILFTNTRKSIEELIIKLYKFFKKLLSKRHSYVFILKLVVYLFIIERFPDQWIFILVIASVDLIFESTRIIRKWTN